jgi:hypothetical protein
VLENRVGFYLSTALKVALVALLAYGAFSGAQQFEGKAFGWRLATYPAAGLVIPIIWALRGKRPPYPHLADFLLVAPFFIDVAGNALDLYDTIWWWDDANHFFNWALLSGSVAVLLRRTSLNALTRIALTIGYGGVIAILWELAEYVAFIRFSPELQTAYTDTLGDMALGLAGSVVAAITAAPRRPPSA